MRRPRSDDAASSFTVKQHSDIDPGRESFEFIRRDTGGIAPDVAKRLAQELVVREGVDILGGFVLTPNALAAADVSAEAKKFMVVMNAATAVIITKSPYMARTSLTIPQLNETFGAWAYKSGIGRSTRWYRTTVPASTRRKVSAARLQGRRW